MIVCFLFGVIVIVKIYLLLLIIVNNFFVVFRFYILRVLLFEVEIICWFGNAVIEFIWLVWFLRV